MGWVGRFRRFVKGGRRLAAFAAAPVVVAGLAIAPVAVQAVVHPAVAQAATKSVLILGTSVGDGLSSPEAADVPSGVSVTVASAATWDGMTTAQFEAYSAIVIGDPSASGTCSSSVVSAALSDASTWGAAVTSSGGYVSVLGTAPALAGSSATALVTDAVGYALSGSGTGLYVSLNCDYGSSSAGTAVPLLAGVYGGGFGVTGRGSSCPDSGTVNTGVAEGVPSFSGLASGELAGWASPACPVEETLSAWPANFTAAAYDAAATPGVFTASDGATGQPYVLLGVPASAASVLGLSPATGGEVQSGATTGASNAADPGLSASEATAADPVDPETGELTESATDASVPGYGPPLEFDRTYDSALAQQEAGTGTPGPLGYGWTDDYASSVKSGTPVPGDIYTVDGLDTNLGNGGVPTGQPLDSPGAVAQYDGDTYIADTVDNRVTEIAGANETEWGISMTAGHMYTVAGSPAGVRVTLPTGPPARRRGSTGPAGSR